MKYLVIALVVEFILNDNGGYGMKSPSLIHHNRRLLDDSPDNDQTKSMYAITSDKGPMTAVVLKNKLIALPETVITAKTADAALIRKSSNAGWSFWAYLPAKESNWVYYSYTGGDLTFNECEIVGAKTKIAVTIKTAKPDTADVETVSHMNTLCSAEVGGALRCDGKLVGLLHHLLSTKQQTEEPEPTVTETEVVTEETVPGTDKPPEEIDEPPPKDRKKREEETECSNSGQVTLIAKIKEAPVPPPKKVRKKVKQRRKIPVVRASDDAISTFFGINLLLITILLFSSIILL